LHLKHGYTQAQIAAHLGLHYATVSRIVNRQGNAETRPGLSRVSSFRQRGAADRVRARSTNNLPLLSQLRVVILR
jgi:IS30 family transposase